MAKNWLAGRGLTYTHLGIVYYSFAPPLHAWISAASYWLTGSIVPLMVIQVAAGAATCVATASIADRIFRNRGAALAAGALTALHPGLAYYSAAKAHPLPFDAHFFTLVLLQFMRLFERPGVARAAVLGVVIGLGTLTRSTMLVFAPIGAAWLFAVTPGAARVAAVRAIAIAAAVAVVVILPWSIRDSLQHHRPIFLISTTGEDFWDGNNPMATGHSYVDRNHALINTLTPADRAELASQPDEIAQSEWFTRKAMAFIHEQPGAAARLTVKKFFHFWWFAPQTGVLYPSGWRQIYMAYYVVVLVTAAAGVIALRARRDSIRLGLLVGLFLLGLSVVQSLYYVEARHRWAIEPMLMALSGGAIAMRRTTA
jgi:4-amino-4-deoxy-L-arabinose transferase-like glycosyltransferase